MDENALAKSDPIEDIQTHTDALLDNLVLLQGLYPQLNVNWDLLELACIYHDIGKLYSKFQSKVKPGGRRYHGELPHGMISTFFIDVPILKSAGFSNDDIQLLFQVVAYHHERHTDSDNQHFDNRRLEEEIRYEIGKQDLRTRYERFVYPRLPGRQVYEEVRKKYFSVGIRISNGNRLFFPAVILKGMLNRLDYAASAHIEVENPNDFLCGSLSRWQAESPDVDCWNQMQCYLRENTDKNVIVIAQTGMGKTEGGLLWLGNTKGFFTLPLKSAINSIYDRACEIVTEKTRERVGLLHSETYSRYLSQAEPDEEDSTEIYYIRTKQLSLPLTICTLDQIFHFVFLYRGFEERLATLSYSKIIIDEVQMYSPSLIAYLVVGLSYITKLGGHFAILTATLPAFVTDLLQEKGIPFEPPKVFVNDAIRHSIKVLEKPIDAQDIFSNTEQHDTTKVLVICNTIKVATDIFEQLKELFKGWDVHLLHSGFIRKDRKVKESEITETGKKGSAKSGIWVATQVVEASLDIDFDLLFTELSDLNGLFQRMGRCYRHRTLSTGYNCFVFTGGAKHCSGVGIFIDEHIHDLSKKELRNGVISEREKVDIVSRVYDKEQIPDYYAKVENYIKYIQTIDAYDFSKTEAIKEFRDIHTVPVIPACMREQYSNEINQAVADLQRKYAGIPKEQARAIRAKARDVLNSLTVDIPEYLARKIHSDPIYINDYESFRVADIDYNDEVGIIKPEKGSTDGDIRDRMF